jgi:hypothetical protein
MAAAPPCSRDRILEWRVALEAPNAPYRRAGYGRSTRFPKIKEAAHSRSSTVARADHSNPELRAVSGAERVSPRRLPAPLGRGPAPGLAPLRGAGAFPSEQ